MSRQPTDSAPRARSWRSPRWWVEDHRGRVVVAQWPNPALLVWLGCVIAVRSGVVDDHRATLEAAGRGALLVWALDELLRGSSPVRRILGLVVALGMLVRLLG